MTILVQQLREAAERLIGEGENCRCSTVGKFTELAIPATVLALLDEIDRLKAALQEERQMRARIGRAANWLCGYAEGRNSFSRIKEINDAIQEVCSRRLGWLGRSRRADHPACPAESGNARGDRAAPSRN